MRQALPDITIDALAEHIAVIDCTGKILMVNQAWRDFALANGAEPLQVSEGCNYLAVCDAAAPTCRYAAATAALLRDVLAGRRKTASLDYPCDGPGERRWFSHLGRHGDEEFPVAGAVRQT